MKNMFLVLTVLFICNTTSLFAGELENGGGIFESEAQVMESLPQSNADWGAWVCYSRYVGPFGWGNYYGWAYNAWQARSNAIYYCSLQHPDYQNCIITGCYVR